MAGRGVTPPAAISGPAILHVYDIYMIRNVILFRIYDIYVQYVIRYSIPRYIHIICNPIICIYHLYSIPYI